MFSTSKGASNDFVRCGLLTVFSALFFFLMTGDAHAHRVNVFAWVEGEKVHVEGKFAGGKMVHGGDVSVLDSQGNLLLKGKTDENGEFSFKRPGNGALQIVLDTGTGHRAGWKLPGENEKSVDDQDLIAQENEKSGKRTPPEGEDACCEKVQTAVELALDRKLGPIKKMLAEQTASTPDLRDILGGIGYIFGLAGVAAYFHSRRTNKREKDQKGLKE